MTHKLCDYPSPAAWERIRAALEAIVQREQARQGAASEKEEAEHGTR